MDSNASTLTFNSLNDDVRHHILRYFGEKSYMIFGSINKSCNNLFRVKRIPKKSFIYAHATFEQIMQIYDERQEYKNTDEFWEWEGGDQYYDEVDYVCIMLAKGIVLHDRKDIFAWALKKKDQYVLEAICREASKVGKLDIIKEVFAYADEQERNFIINYKGDWVSTDYAARGGHFETLKWLLLNRFYWYSNHICGHAASSGNTEMLNWLLGFPQNFSLNESACSQAASKGQLEMLKLLREEGCPWNSDTCANASAGGHLDVLKWSHENGCEINKRCSELAARGGHLECLKYLHDGCGINKRCSELAARGGHFECLKYLHDNNCPWDSDTAIAATEGGHLDILKYLYMNGCEWNTKIPFNAACPIHLYGRSHMHILEWIHYRGFGFDKEFTVYLASNKTFLPILKWLHHCGYEMYEEMPSVAARNESFDTLRWLRKIGIKWDDYGKYLDGDDTNEKRNKKRKIYK